MDCFEIGCCFKSYEDLTEKLSQYCKETYTRFTTKDCRLIKDEYIENNDAKNRLIYTDLKLICVHGRPVRPKNPDSKRKRAEKNVQTGCPAYFRLKLIQSGVALQIVALNIKHNHPLEPPKDDENQSTGRKKKRGRLSKNKGDKKFKDEFKSEDESDIDNEQDLLFAAIDDEEVDEFEVHFDLKGFCAPVFTPFKNDMSLNTDEVFKYAKYLHDNGIGAVLVNSLIGEGTQLTIEERKSIVETWHEVVKSTKQHLMVQIGGCPLTNVLELAKHAEQLNVNSLLCLPELYFKPESTEDLIEYLKIVSEAVPKTPLLYYHHPVITGVHIDVKKFLKEITEKIPTFRGIYYNSNDLDSVIDGVNDNNRKYSIFFGADNLLAGAFTLGFDSAIVSIVNLFPGNCLELLKASNDSDLSKVKQLQNKIFNAYSQISNFGNWIGTLKTFMNIFTKVNVGPPRPPLKSLAEEQINEIQQDLEFT